MMLSEKAKERLLALLAVSPFLQRFAFPGICGVALIGLGIWQDIQWLAIVGLIVAAPIVWCYLLIMVVYPVILLFDKPPKQYWKE